MSRMRSTSLCILPQCARATWLTGKAEFVRLPCGIEAILVTIHEPWLVDFVLAWTSALMRCGYANLILALEGLR